jgi:hypothetical protein
MSYFQNIDSWPHDHCQSSIKNKNKITSEENTILEVFHVVSWIGKLNGSLSFAIMKSISVLWPQGH